MITVIAIGALTLLVLGWFIYGCGFRHGRSYERLQRQASHYYRPTDQVLRVR